LARQYYFLSDLHLGGDGEMEHCDFADEFVAFLKELAKEDADTELILGGDTFGFWELTTFEGVAKFDEIVSHHQAIFDQLREAGKRITITLMVGNHDYDLACEAAFAGKLKEYNLNLDTAISVKRPLLGRTIWIEHGQQTDKFNASPDYGNKYALPVGYFITRVIVGGASRFSAFGRGNWLKDIRSAGTAHIPDWLLSNYFYREMSWAVRGVLTASLVLFSVTLLAFAAEILRVLGVFKVNVLLDNGVLHSLGLVGSIFSAIVVLNMIIMFFMFVAAIPGFVVLHDLRKTLRRFQFTPTDLNPLGAATSRAPYLARAREVFAANPDVAVYLFGHTHDAFLEQEPDGRVIANMGTWLKILRRVPVRFGYLPSVYYPSFRLNYFHIFAEQSQLVMRYVEVPKKPARELDWLQHLLTIGEGIKGRSPIPDRTVVECPPSTSSRPTEV
jgi:UDP-2,3-diacylglucosamine pyrophosphatase LpxH